MNETKSYLTQYCELSSALKTAGKLNKMPRTQNKILDGLKEKAMEQSGLTKNELVLISCCRHYGIFRKVNTIICIN